MHRWKGYSLRGLELDREEILEKRAWGICRQGHIDKDIERIRKEAREKVEKDVRYGKEYDLERQTMKNVGE